MIDTVTRPALRWYGGKFNLAPWIISHFPAHENYVEPCFGAGSVLLRKAAVKLETANDLNGRVVNFFSVLRTRPDELIRLINLTPWALEEYKACRQPTPNDPVEDARRFYTTCWMSIHGGPLVRSGFRWQASLDSRYLAPPEDVTRNDLDAIIKRLRNVQIMNLDALDLIGRFRNADDALIYFDPPYLKSTRARTNGYADFEVTSDWHVDAAEILRQHSGYVVVSGYATKLYTEIYEAHGWQRVDSEPVQTNGGKRIESLWLNPATVEALATEKQEREREALPLLAYANTHASEPAL